MNLTKQIASVDHGSQSNVRRFGNKLPRADSQQQNDRICRRTIRHPQEFAEYHIHHAEHHQRLKHRPCDAQERSLITELKIRLHQTLQDGPCVPVSVPHTLHQLFHKLYLISDCSSIVHSCQIPEIPLHQASRMMLNVRSIPSPDGISHVPSQRLQLSAIHKRYGCSGVPFRLQ